MNEFEGYDEETENYMRIFFRSLPEDHRRRYAAVEAEKIGYGGISYISRVFNVTRGVISTGLEELNDMRNGDPDHPNRPSGGNRIRRPGAGRPKAVDQHAGLEEAAEKILDAHSAGSPTEEMVIWTNLRPSQFIQFIGIEGYRLCYNTAADLISLMGFRKRSLRKELITGHVDPQERNAQFEYIATLKRSFQAKGLPVFSVDTKKKELLGLLHRPGQCYSTGEQKVYDHDFRHLSEGKAIPHGVYDIQANFGFITVGTTHETSEFVCDAIARCWHWYGRFKYPNAKEILLLFDAGGANSIHSTRFKEDLIGLSRRTGLKLRVTHYPPYTSKWNPIEHRLFSQLEKSLRGIIPDSIETVCEAIQNTSTTTGLRVKAYILDKVYLLQRKCSKNFETLKKMYIRHETDRLKWNYIVDAAGV